MENEFKHIDHEDEIDRELKELIREVEEAEHVRRAVIGALVMLGSDAMLEAEA